MAIEHILGDPELSANSAKMVVIRYTNHRGETADRRIEPRSIHFGATEWHPEPQWLLTAWDFDKQAFRDFAVKDIAEWRPWKGGTGDA